MAVFTPFLPRDTPFKFITVCGVDYNLSSLNAVEQTGEPITPVAVWMVLWLPCLVCHVPHTQTPGERETHISWPEQNKDMPTNNKKEKRGGRNCIKKIIYIT